MLDAGAEGIRVSLKQPTGFSQKYRMIVSQTSHSRHL